MKNKAGISKLAVSLRWSPEMAIAVGTLYRSSATGAILFEHDVAFLQRNISLSPLHETYANLRMLFISQFRDAG